VELDYISTCVSGGRQWYSWSTVEGEWTECGGTARRGESIDPRHRRRIVREKKSNPEERRVKRA
jgi:hypothetical protein